MSTSLHDKKDISLDSMESYYAKRAREYENIYHRPDSQRQQSQTKMAQAIERELKGKNVIEIACGTGFWTQFASNTATRITSTDINQEVIEITEKKIYKCPVTFQIADAYNLPFKENSFTGGLANFWFSHIPKAQRDQFLQEFHRVLKPNSKVFIADNALLVGPNNLILKEGDDNTYKLRKLLDGSEHIILKNYFTAQDLINIFQKYVPHFSKKNIYIDKYFWYVAYEVQK